MALPIPPKYRRFTEKNDSKHAEKQRAKRAARKAELERLMREREREEFYRRLRESDERQARLSQHTDMLNNTKFYYVW